MDYTEYEMDTVPHQGGWNKFFAEVEEVKRDLMHYDDMIERVDRLHRRMVGETQASALEQISGEIESITTNARGLANQLKIRIKDLQSQSTDETRRSHSENLKRQFMTSIQKFQAQEAMARQQQRKITERQVRLVNPEATESQVEQYLDSGREQVFADALMHNKRGAAQSALEQVQSRHTELVRIEQTMAELAQLFHDMEIMVAEQDTQIQQIDDTTAAAQQDVEMGVGHQTKAVISARKARKKKIICACILAAIVIILAVVLGAYFGTR